MPASSHIVLSVLFGLLSVTCNIGLDRHSQVLSALTGVMLHGTYDERHAMAKGQSTQYGHIGVDCEQWLLDHGWSDESIHEIGALLGVARIGGVR